ncbi:MAG TPA: HPP family protein [Longimicrobiaceae bacterium]|nr:HPP family protein [Longimicrobiaceae bacterium]
MTNEMASLEPSGRASRKLRRRLTLKGELMLALLPTLTVLAVLGFVEVLSEQRLLFASLASSAFLIYLDPQHGTNSVRTLTVSQLMAAGIGWTAYVVIGSGYLGAGGAMVATIFLMILLDVVHPPAVATAMSFALRAGGVSNLVLFGMSVGITAMLVITERVAVWLLARYPAR